MAGPLTALAVGTLLGASSSRDEDGPTRHSSEIRTASHRSGEYGAVVNEQIREGDGEGGDDEDDDQDDDRAERELRWARREDEAVWAERYPEGAARPANGISSGETKEKAVPKVCVHEAERPLPTSTGSSSSATEASGSEKRPFPTTNILPRSETHATAEFTPPKYRWTPILSGLLQPFAILLEIPGLTEHWYVRLDRSTNQPVAYQENPTWLNAALGISLGCALIANVSLICRFLERKVLASTITCIVALSIHDIINIVIVSIFGVIHGVDDGFDYSQAFWLCVCSTAASFFTNCTLVYDLVRTKDFRHSGSGLTLKQRNLVIVVMILLAYLALGALAFDFLIPDMNFQSALYFTVVSLETIGFGDIAPSTVGSKAFLFFYLPVGIFLLAIVVGTTRSTLLEWTAATYKRRRHRILQGYRKRKVQREEEAARREAVEKRIQALGQPIYVNTSGQRPKLNVEVLSAGQVMSAEMDARAKALQRTETMGPLSPLAVHETNARLTRENGPQDARGEALRLQAELQKQSAENEELYRGMQEALAREEKVENYAKMSIAIFLFVVFWIVGATVFARTEEWSWFIAFYFCFVTFTSVGYGDSTPTSPAGRAFFLIWAMVGVGNVTILIAVIADGYSSRFRSKLQRQGTRGAIHTRVNEWAHNPDVDNEERDRSDDEGSFRRMGAEIVEHLTKLHNQVNALRLSNSHTIGTRDPDREAFDNMLREYMDEAGMSEEEKTEVLGDIEMRKAVFFKAYERTVMRLLSLAAVAARPTSDPSAERSERNQL